MKKLILFTMASMMTVFAMAIGRNDGSTQGNAIDFDWDKGITHDSGTKWYRVDLAPLYEEDNPSLTLYLTNPSNAVGTSVDVSMTATVAGQVESKDYTIAARQYKTYTANASMLVMMKQTEIYLTLTSNGTIKLSAKVFEAADLDETCKDARTLSWGVVATQNPMYSAWWRVSLKPIKDVMTVDGFDAKITITNTGSKKLNLKVGQSLDCPSSGLTKRSYELAPGEQVIDTVPRSMINSVQPDELYFGIENVESPISILVEKVAQPTTAVIPTPDKMDEVGITNEFDLHVTDTMVIPAGKTLYRIKVADMDSIAKYEPEFTYRNEGEVPAKMTIKMAFERPAYGTSNTDYSLAPGEEEIVVYKKNMLEGMGNVDSIYLLTITDQPINFYGRFKHVREGKACKTNIDFNWESGHTQEARTTQWYAINVAEARDNMRDLRVFVVNQGNASASVKASFAFSCPYIDLQEMTGTLNAKGDTLERRIGFSTYALMTDVVWVGVETSQDIRFWADTVSAQTKEVADHACETAVDFNWEEGIHQNANDTVWYRIDMNAVRESTAKFPTLFMQNLSSTDSVIITTEQSLECPDIIENEVRTIKIAPNGSYTSKLSRNLFENIVQDELWVRITGTQEFSLQMRLTEEAAGASCASAIPFNWQSGNLQDANANLWYVIDLRNVMKKGNDLKLHIQNRDNAECKGLAQLVYTCPVEETPTVQRFTLAAKAERNFKIQNSALETLSDSIIYINLEGSTSLRFWADTLEVEPFDTIFADNLNLIELHWNKTYVQNVDTAWYIIPQSQIDSVRNLEKKVKPVAFVDNLSSKELTIKAEIAYAFPITKSMMSKSQTLKAGKSTKDTVPASTFDQMMKKDSIIIRVTRTKGAGDFQFGTELVSATTGNTRDDALPIHLGDKFTQSPNSAMWYRLNTADLKKDKNLFNKILYVASKNAGKSDAKVKVAIYEGRSSKTDMLEMYGLGNYRERTIKKGENRSHNIPAQFVYGLGDVDLFIEVTTTDSLVFETKFIGEYAPITSDPKQQEAKLLVPNVDYIVDGDNEEHWYQICLPYIRNNYMYTHESSLTYELEETATIETTSTFQDVMDCQMPVRKRTVNKAGKHYKGTQPLSDLVNKGIKRAIGQNFDISTFQEAFVDSMLHRYITSDSITLYIRLKTSADMKVRLNMPQITGGKCLNPMDFDWEHGNINPKDSTTWLHVALDSTRVPEGKDLKLHMDNWTDGATNVKATIFQEDCNGTELISVKRLMQSDTAKVIDRDLLVKWGWSGMMIEYASDSVTHIWAELVDHVRDTVFDTIPKMFVCPMTEYTDSIGGTHVIDPSDPAAWKFTVTKDSIFESEAKIVTYMYTYEIYPKALPELPAIPSLAPFVPVVTKGEVLDCSSATAMLYGTFNAPALSDSIMKVGTGDSIKWEYCVDGENWLEIPATPLDTAAIALRYVIITECGDILTSAPWVNVPTEDVYVTACDSYTWPLNEETYTSSQVANEEVLINSLTSKNVVLHLTINQSSASELDVVACEEYEWHGAVYAASGDYTFTTTNVVGCDSVITLHLTINHVSEGDTAATACSSFDWHGATYTESGEYKDTVKNVANCDSIITLHLTINQPSTAEETEEACDEFVWNNKTYTESGDYSFDTINAAGCDSVVTLHLTVYKSVTTKDTVLNECNEFTWDLNDSTYYVSGDYTAVGQTVHGCDSTVHLHLTINNPKLFELEVISKYGDRLLMINRFEINDSLAAYGVTDKLDSIGAFAIADEVTWWRMENAIDENPDSVGTGYYITNEKDPGEPIEPGIYYARIRIPAADGSLCGVTGETAKLIVGEPKTASPALMPSMARPGEDITIINLDPALETTINIYSSEGMITGTHTVTGVESYVIKAAAAQGIYLVDVRNEDIQSTLRYIVK